ncbi:unnamed protein product [Rotaria magnacalcarata]|uniref:Uncharacterized protein n=1 Tax=Rotaria magnacalcarata TaxID=392030 RepID=A0A819IR06_9BILA|nr:unnamed protein product [Rotaria magnacalcarata]CAF2110803.1 unnamed protein product [Rotaria magnacalcarata]CAF3915886.1 unnamed protein product [Rotaria magnacalcarata]CAF3974756.1 unnamed protein product [Rotaria magnacalcarata]
MTTNKKPQTVDDILRQVETLKKHNDEIFKYIDGRNMVNKFQYNVTQSMVNDCYKFDVTENTVEESGNTIINSWHSSIQMTVIPDIFNDKINHSCSNYADLVRLNSEMYIVVQKYELFGDSDRARQEMLKFLENFRLIQTNLKLIEAKAEHEINKLEELKNKINDINHQFENLMKNYRLTFGIQNLIPKGELQCYECGAKPTTMIYYKNEIEPNRVDTFRTDGYSAVCVHHTQIAIDKHWTLVDPY